MADEKVDPFDSSGQARGYITLDQARVLAIQHARDNTDFYDDPSIRHEPLVWEVEGQHETEDFFEIRLSFRPARGFRGQAGIELFTIDRVGKIELRRMVRELVREPGSEPIKEPVRREARPRSTSPFPWKVVAGVTVGGLAVAIVIIGFAVGVIGGGDDSDTPVPPAKETIRISMASSITKWE